MVTYENIIQIELIDDPTDIAERRNAAGFGGEAQACNRCGKRSVAIAAILIVPAGGDTCWELCGECLRAMPHWGLPS